ncbi:MAG TPA: TolC family protein [Firmicutes bacterium]|nr:TolC family protein [Bacillota bacterium]
MMGNWKRSKFLFIVLGVLLLLPGVALAAQAKPMAISLEQARELALTQGTGYLFLELGQEKAGKMLDVIRKEFRLGAVGVSDSRTLKKRIDEIEAIVDDRSEKIKFLNEEIGRWTEVQDELEEGDQGRDELQKKIDAANEEIGKHQQVIDDLRPAFSIMIPHYYQIKEIEDMAKPQLDPVVANVNALSDALKTQPKVINYNVEKIYLSLLTMSEQENHLEKKLSFLQKMHQREQRMLAVGMETVLKFSESEIAVEKGKEGLRSLRAAKDSLERSFLSLLGFPVDFAFTLQPVEPSIPAIDLDKLGEPDLMKSVTYLRAKSDLGKEREDFEDTSKDDKTKYRLAELSVMEAEVNLQDTIEQLKANYENRRDALFVAEKALKNAKLALVNARESLKQAEIKYKVGFISGVEMEQKVLAMEEAGLNCQLATNDLYLAANAYILAREGIELP